MGRAPENHIVLDDEGIAPIHARLIKEDDKFFLKDNNSSSGCFVNGQRITQKEIGPGDLIRLGSVEMMVLDPRSLPNQPEFTQDDQAAASWRLVSDSSWLSGKQFTISTDKTTVIGRSSQCDIVIPGTHLSRRHVELYIEGNHLRVKDLASANGTFLNELRIDNTTANNGDRLRVDVYSFRVVAPETEETQPRIRKPLDELVKPIERKVASTAPRRWITRPTSPGNRIELGPQHQTRGFWLVFGLALLIASATFAFFVWT